MGRPLAGNLLLPCSYSTAYCVRQCSGFWTHRPLGQQVLPSPQQICAVGFPQQVAVGAQQIDPVALRLRRSFGLPHTVAFRS
mmetsp:Transcript_72126/g.188096  ORF Transcript_72126/g.188096 Transcript_72126/m.188096 type:complete len:82 (-) Transcript_72126:208-453(-)